MKYIKAYENISKYKEGDYVYIEEHLVKGLPLEPKRINYNFKYCKIMNVMTAFDPTIHLPWIQYTAEVFNEDKNKFENEYIEENMIIRKMTNTEISKFKELKELIKYNI